LEELVTNLHMHTIYSDGTGTHRQLAEAALRTHVDVLISTDHNVLVHGLDGYHEERGRRVLLLTAEEINDRQRDAQKNHLLVIGANRELCQFAGDPQRLIEQVTRAGGLSFIAHPFETDMPAFNESSYEWVNWDVDGFTGLEIWNGLSELKTVARNVPQAIFYAFFPRLMPRGADEKTLQRWDELLASGKRVVAVGGSDAHALTIHRGPFKRVIFPYEFHFSAVNNHLLTPTGLTGELLEDRKMVLNALRRGNSFVGYDLPAPTRGFRFTAQGRDATAQMGDEIDLGSGVTLQIRMPLVTECRLIKDGSVLRTWRDRDICSHVANQPGVYRVECSIEYAGRMRGWIYSNPIHVRSPQIPRRWIHAGQ